MKVKVRTIIIVFIAVVAFVLLYPATRSYLVMKTYSSSESKTSVMTQNNFKIKIPSNSEWYPFVMTFNADYFDRWSNTDAQMSIMYNFGKFDIKKSTSQFFNPESEKYSSFYGAYAISQPTGSYGFTDGELNIKEISKAFKYDYIHLVLKSFDYKSSKFEITDYNITTDVEFIGYNGWTQLDAVIDTSGVAHQYSEFYTSYMQYGKPKYTVSADYAEIKMYGKLYIRYFEQYNSTILVYVMSPSLNTINACDKDILSRTQIVSLP